MGIVIRLLVSAVALWVTTALFSDDVIGDALGGPRISFTDDTFSGSWFIALILVAAIFGIVNAVLRPIIKTVGCALYVLTLGLFAVIVNGALLMLTGWIAEGLDIGFVVGPTEGEQQFWPSAVLGAVVIGLVSWLLNQFVKGRRD